MIKVTIDIPKAKFNRVDSLFVRAIDGVKDVRAPLIKCGELMVASVQKNFIAGGRPTSWKPLSKMTIGLRKGGLAGGSAKPLRNTGKLMNSITYSNPDSNSIKIGTNVKYAKIQQFGGTVRIPAHQEKIKAHKRKDSDGDTYTVEAYTRKAPARTFKIPARPFLMFQDADREAIRQIFGDYLKSLIKNTNG